MHCPFLMMTCAGCSRLVRGLAPVGRPPFSDLSWLLPEKNKISKGFKHTKNLVVTQADRPERRPSCTRGPHRDKYSPVFEKEPTSGDGTEAVHWHIHGGSCRSP